MHGLHQQRRCPPELGRNEEAIVWYDKAIEIDPQYALAYINKGLFYLNLAETKRLSYGMRKP